MPEFQSGSCSEEEVIATGPRRFRSVSRRWKDPKSVSPWVWSLRWWPSIVKDRLLVWAGHGSVMVWSWYAFGGGGALKQKQLVVPVWKWRSLT